MLLYTTPNALYKMLPESAHSPLPLIFDISLIIILSFCFSCFLFFIFHCTQKYSYDFCAEKQHCSKHLLQASLPTDQKDRTQNNI